MKLPIPTIILGAILAALGWVVSWKLREPGKEPNTGDTKVETSQPPRAAVSNTDLLDQFETASSRFEKYQAALAFQKMSRIGLRESLETIATNLENGKLTREAQLLLVEWARRTPKEAMKWSWDNLRKSRNWPNAFQQIAQQWAWDQPDEFTNFVLQNRDPQIDSGEMHLAMDFTFQELSELEKPTFRFEMLRNSMEWVGSTSLYHGFKILRVIPGSSGRDELMEGLQTSSDLAEALSAWDDYSADLDERSRTAYQEFGGFIQDEPEAIRKEKHKIIIQFYRTRPPREQQTVQMLIQRWKDLDPDGFSKSRFGAWDKEGP